MVLCISSMMSLNWSSSTYGSEGCHRSNEQKPKYTETGEAKPGVHVSANGGGDGTQDRVGGHVEPQGSACG